jgi:hypothetical protein
LSENESARPPAPLRDRLTCTVLQCKAGAHSAGNDREVRAMSKEKGAKRGNEKKPAQKTLKEKRQAKKAKAK